MAKIEERDEEISEEELMRAMYPSPLTEGGNQEPTRRRRGKRSRNKRNRPGIEPRHIQQMTKDTILEMVEQGEMTAEQGRKEYKKLEE